MADKTSRLGETLASLPARPATRWLITTENPDYNEITAGIRFNQGRAVFDPGMVDPLLGLTAEEVLARIRDLPGYTVTELVD